MVVYVDLDEDAADPAIRGNNSIECSVRLEGQQEHDEDGEAVDALTEDIVQRLNGLSNNSGHVSAFAIALGCYPIVKQIAKSLDLNALHDLAATCRQFRANMLQFRSQLIKSTLRCSNEELEGAQKLASHSQEFQNAQLVNRSDPTTPPASPPQNATSTGQSPAIKDRLTSGRAGQCARDMVGECRRCGMIVCRNCSIKPPSTSTMSGRHRRLCRTCMKAPLNCHLSRPLDTVEPVVHRLALGGLVAANTNTKSHFTFEAFSRSPCSCPTAVFICRTCGSSLRSIDITYMRGWSWRSKYSHFAGYGAGIGEGNEGVECGRASECLAAKEVEKEIDCDADELANLRRESENAEKKGRHWGGTSYMAQQIEGIGGVMKTKVKRLVKVGHPVKEYEDERENGQYLGREAKGLNRSWCSWCNRVILSNKDQGMVKDGVSGLYRPLTNSSSSSVGSLSQVD